MPWPIFYSRQKALFMARTAWVTGILLCILAAIGYGLAPAPRSPTALIPMFVGLPILISGVLAQNPARRKTAMHIAAGIGMLGLLASAGRAIPTWLKLVRGEEVNLLALSMVTAMAVVCAGFVVRCVQSFIAARRARNA
jgi:uncharacterized membrane protein